VAERFHSEYGVPIDWQPFLLRPEAPDEGWPLPDAIKAKMNRPDNPLQLRAQALGLPLVERSHVPSSRRALQANEFVRQAGGLQKLDAFHSAVNARYWGKGEDLSQWPVLESAAKEIGVDAAAMREQVEAGAFREAVEKGIADAHRIGIHAVPTYLFMRGDEPLFAIQGAQEWDMFQRAAKRLGLQK
jgi:predicted DsbA family dithiol-disulfide isomerase